MTAKAKAKTEQPPTEKPLDLAEFSSTDDGRQIIAMALDLRQACEKAKLPKGSLIGGVAPFADMVMDQARAEGFLEGRQYERLSGKYSNVVGSQS